MAVEELTLNVPLETTLGATWQEFKAVQGRNMIVHLDEAVYYHPAGAGLDGTVVGTAERQKLGAGTRSIRLPGSGSGRDAVTGGQAAAGLDESSAFAFSAITGSPSIWITIVNENSSK